jgi:hypothetical protein
MPFPAACLLRIPPLPCTHAVIAKARAAPPGGFVASIACVGPQLAWTAAGASGNDRHELP